MDWTVYWFMFPACVVIAAVAARHVPSQALRIGLAAVAQGAWTPSPPRPGSTRTGGRIRPLPKELAWEGGLSAIPWNLLAWTVPGAVIDAFVGTRLQGRVSEDAARYLCSGLFLAIGTTFLVAFTVFRGRFA